VNVDPVAQSCTVSSEPTAQSCTVVAEDPVALACTLTGATDEPAATAELSPLAS
jgi:hypothetical protein